MLPKKVLFLLISYLSIFNCLAQSNYSLNLPYNFPVGRPEIGKYAANDRDKLCQVPDSALHKMTTRALVLTCLNYPRLMDFIFYDSPLIGFAYITSQSNVFEELSERPDVKSILLTEFVNYKVSPLSSFSDSKKAHEHFLSSAGFAAMMSDERILNQLTPDESKTLVKSCIEKSDVLKGDPASSNLRSYLFIPMAKVLYPRLTRSSNPLLTESRNAPRIIAFLDSGRQVHPDVLDEMNANARQYILN